MEPPSNIGTANFLEVFFIERYKSIEEYVNGEVFHYWVSSFSKVPL